ncbi:MAG: Npt1/Npt2 family nucleotide transporter [Myxococcota bacterium]
MQHSNYSSHRYQQIALVAFGFLLMLHYGIISICVDSLFLQHYNGEDLTRVWLLTALMTLVCVQIYNSYTHRYRIITLLTISCIVAAIPVIAALFAYRYGIVGALLFLKAWKDTYIIVLVQMFWSFASLIFSFDTAKNIYGRLLAVSTAGTVVGYGFSALLAQHINTLVAAWCCLPMLLVCCPLVWYLRQVAGEKPPVRHVRRAIHSGFDVVWHSRYLFLLLLVTLAAKTVITFIDYELNVFMKEVYSNTDDRTVFTSQIRFYISTLAILLQVVFTPLVRTMGLAVLFFATPIFMGVSMLLHVVYPLLSIVMVYVVSKSLDYSLLRLCRELLYVPLSRDEKTRGKACIDVLIFRLSKGSSSLLLMAILQLQGQFYLPFVTMAIEVAWLLLAGAIMWRFYALQRDKKRGCIVPACKTGVIMAGNNA